MDIKTENLYCNNSCLDLDLESDLDLDLEDSDSELLDPDRDLMQGFVKLMVYQEQRTNQKNLMAHKTFVLRLTSKIY